MAEPEVETVAKLKGDMQAVTNNSAMLEAEGGTAREDGVGSGVGGVQQPDQEDNSYGMLVLAGEIQERDPDGDNPRLFDVVAVHGLDGDREDNWTTDSKGDEPGGNWLKDRIFERYPGSRILTFGYDLNKTKSRNSAMAGIMEKALHLLDDLVEFRRADPDASRPLVFIAHDLGGIVVKMVGKIAKTALRREYRLRASAVLTAHIFFGCPHRYTNAQDLEDRVANLWFASKNLRPIGAIRNIKELGRSIVEINGFFAVSNMPWLLDIVNVFSEAEDAALQLLWGSHSKNVLAAQSLTKIYASSLNTTISAATEANGSSIKCLQTLGSLAAPVYPLESLYGPDHQLSWLSSHETYTKWLDGYGPSILHVHGTVGASDASEYIFQHLNAYRTEKQNSEILVYFAFISHHDRCNSVVAMLNTLLAQILSHNPNLFGAVARQYEQMSFHRSWTEGDLWLFFRNILSFWGQNGILCVINGLDECDDSWTGFLKNLCSLASLTERRWKIAITSTGDPDLQAALADWPAINLDDQPGDPGTANTNLASDTDLEVLELIQERPAFSDFEKTITERLFECGQDKDWRRLVLNQLRFSKSPSTKSAAQRELDLLPPAIPKDIFVRILANVPPERRAWARKALIWILYAFRPLTIWELGVALALEVDSLPYNTIDLDELVYRHVIADLGEVFGGMFVVKQNEVRFGHPEVRKFLLAADGGQKHIWYDVKDTAHQEITDACHFYLSLQQVQNSIAMSYDNSLLDSLEAPTFISRDSLRAYAVRYWPRHYELIPETFRPTKRVLDFVQNTKSIRCWAEAYWWFLNSTSRTDRGFLSLLPIFAGLGLQDLVAKWLDRDSETPESGQDRALALTEAARNTHVKVVRRLLSCGEYDQASLQDALIAGASCCDEAVMDELIMYTAESIERFEWPSAILCRTAQHGLDKVARKLLKSGASPDTAVTLNGMTPLHFAARHGHAEVVKVLLEHRASLTASDTFDDVPLHTASAYSHATVAKLLLDAGAEVNVVDSRGISAMYFTCMAGSYKVTKILAEAGFDMGGDSQSNWPILTAAAMEGLVKTTRTLLEISVDTEVGRQESWTPLRYAALRGHVELCQALLENGANPNTPRGGDPILGESADRGSLEVVKLLVENGAVVDAIDDEGSTALQKASMRGHISIVTYLLEHGADINHTNNIGYTPVLLAAESGFAEIVQLLIDRGADPHRAVTAGWTPIHLSYEHAEATRVLMENGADANRIANYYTPLHLAASNNHVEVVKVLLSFNLDIDIQCPDGSPYTGYTALTMATVNGYADIVRLLLEAGANINHKSEHNFFPLQYAVTYDREDIFRILMEYGPDLDLVDDDGDTALNCIQSSTPLSIVKLLINGGSDPQTRNNKRDTPLCKAAYSGNLDVVKYLITKKAELNVIGGGEGSPLHIACRRSNLELVKILVAAGADVNLVAPNFAGTPIQSACFCQNSGNEKETHESIISYLINEAKADVTVFGGLQGCALNAACGWSTPEMVRLILEKGAKIDVKDAIGRVAIHFAASQSPAHFQVILNAGADVEVRDRMGRTALHWAIIGGLIDTVERILSLSRGLVDQADIDGWTPLLWAARGVGKYLKPVTSNVQEIIKLLLDRGADPCVRGKGLDREWSPVKIARYHGLSDAVIQLLMAKTKDKLEAEGNEDAWDEAFHTSGKAQQQNCYCDSCFLNKTVVGIGYECETCSDFDLCYKCYPSRLLIHPDHPFKIIGPEYEPITEEAPAEKGNDDEDEEEDGDDDDDDDDDDDEDED
ncbi:hypothetical protein GP486_005013 [Trichoglossum hirsutum]|uniref:Nephrocystin 3-like N-terminal domain-containing protein n=1 Tax=Trichoglossum hirsutum TaxID=265104 RepID=A0A9P8RN08_9PEZI|nr:hypothetical protein GP486_005013 [Trichoglossum hirsutum]